MNKNIFLSYMLDKNTPTYGNRNKFNIEKKSSILNGDVANESNIDTTVHIGTHIDMPYHFYENGQTIEDFNIDFFVFNNVLFLEIDPNDLIIKDELINALKQIDNKNNIDSIIVKTGICYYRNEEIFWKKNYGFHPEIARFLRKHFPNVRIFGFDSISVSSFANRMLGREAHKAFLNPVHPILLVEDMNLTQLAFNSEIEEMIIAPLRISKCDGLPCTIFAKIRND